MSRLKDFRQRKSFLFFIWVFHCLHNRIVCIAITYKYWWPDSITRFGVCVCVCVWKREKQRESVCVWESACVWESEGQEINDAKEKGDGAWPRPFFWTSERWEQQLPELQFSVKNTYYTSISQKLKYCNY